MIIKLNTIEDINNFVTICKGYHDYEVDVKQGRQVIDGKSILGIYSLNLIKPLEVIIDTKDKNIISEFYENITKWNVA